MSRLVDSSGEEVVFGTDVLSYAPGVEVSQNPAAPQSIATAFTAVSFAGGTKVRDTDGFVDLVLAPTRLTAKIAGRYRVYGVAGYNPASAQYSRLKIYKNGVDLNRHVGGAVTVAGGYANNEIVAEIDMVVGDYVELYAFFSAGGSVTVPAETWFGMSLIGNNIVLPVRAKPVVWQASGGTFPTGPFARYDVLEYAMADPSGGTVIWNFVYRDDLDATRPWHFKGGPPIIASVMTQEVLTPSGAWANLATDGPKIVLPRAGDWDVDMRALVTEPASSGASAVFIGATIGDTAPASSAQSLRVDCKVGQTSQIVETLSGPVRVTGAAAGATLKMRYESNAVASTVYYQDRMMFVRPVRMA